MSIREDLYKNRPLTFLAGAFTGFVLGCGGTWLLVNSFYEHNITDFEKQVKSLQDEKAENIKVKPAQEKPQNPLPPTIQKTSSAHKNAIIKQLEKEIASKEAQRAGLSPLLGNTPPSEAYNRLISEIDNLKAKRLELLTSE